MPAPAGNSATASVVVLALADFALRPVAEQARHDESHEITGNGEAQALRRPDDRGSLG